MLPCEHVTVASSEGVESDDHSDRELMSPTEQENHTDDIEDTTAESRPVTEESHNENTEDEASTARDTTSNTITTGVPEDCIESHDVNDDADVHTPVQVADETTPSNLP